MIILSDLRDYTQTIYLFLYQRKTQFYITACNEDIFLTKNFAFILSAIFRNYLI